MMVWFQNHTGSRDPDLINAEKVSKNVVNQLVAGGVAEKRVIRLQRKFVYLDLFGARLEPIIDAQWSVERAAKGYVNDAHKLVFMNRLLGDLLEAEPTDVKERVDAYREEEYMARLAKTKENTYKEQEEALAAIPGSSELSSAEREDRLVAISRQRCVFCFLLSPACLKSSVKGRSTERREY